MSEILPAEEIAAIREGAYWAAAVGMCDSHEALRAQRDALLAAAEALLAEGEELFACVEEESLEANAPFVAALDRLRAALAKARGEAEGHGPCD